jgi:hypothetical protein
MTDINIFEQAARVKLRFSTTRGELTVEDILQLPLEAKSGVSLDGLAVALDTELKNSAPKSFVGSTSAANKTLQLKFDIVKYVLDTRIAENAVKNAATVKATQLAKLQETLAAKKDAAIGELSVEQLEAQIAALKA